MDEELQQQITHAVRAYWLARDTQATKQRDSGTRDAGTRGEVTGGQHLDAFCELICTLIITAGFDRTDIRFRTGVEVPGYYRPTKKWDIVVTRKDRLCAAIELKSQVGSFGNNVNNRTEEAVGSATDLWVAFREHLLGAHPPWLGYFFFLEDAPGSTTPVRLPRQMVFPPDNMFQDTSYAQRYQILCQRMVLERNYNAASLLLSRREGDGAYRELMPEFGFAPFVKSLFGHLLGCL